MAPHSSTLAWKIPWMEEPGRLQSMGSQTVRHDWVTSLSLFTFMHWRRKWQPTPVFVPGESQGPGSLVGCHLWGRTESDTTEATQQQQQQSKGQGGLLPIIKDWIPKLTKLKLYENRCHPLFTSLERNEISESVLYKSFSCIQLIETAWIVAHQSLLSMESSRQGYWNGFQFPSS